jgi:hypothetical protein
MADEQIQQLAPGSDPLENLVAQMLSEQKSPAEIDAVIQMYDDQQHPLRAAFQGGTEGLFHGALGALTAPWDLAKGTVLDTLSLVKGETPENAKAFLEGLGEIPQQWSQGGVRERAEMLGNLLGGSVTGVGTAKAVPLSAPAAARTVGKGLQYIGEHPFPAHISGATGVGTGIMTGRPELVAAGMAAQAVPYAANKAGQALRIWGGESPAVVRLGQKGVQKLEDQFDEAMVKRGMEFQDEVATAPKSIAQKIDDAVAAGTLRRAPEGGMPARAPFPGIRMQGAPGGIKVVGEEAATLAGPAGLPEASGPAVTPTGKAAMDLARGKAPAAPPVGPKATLDELAVKQGTGVDFDQAVFNEQMATENASRLQNRNTRVPVQEGIPASKSKSPKSATPGLTRADLMEAGLNPDLNYKDLTPQMIERIKRNRASRHATNYENAKADKAVRSMGEGQPLVSLLEQALLERLR